MARGLWRATATGAMTAAVFALAGHAQSPTAPAPQAAQDLAPIAFVPFGGSDPMAADKVKGQIEVEGGKAILASSGEVTAGAHAARVQLTHRGELHLCPTTTVALAAANPRTEDLSGLMLSLSRGALEARYQTGRNADLILTPDFRIAISGPGVANVDVRLADHGDTCVDNHGDHPATIVVSSVFEGGAYSVGPGQRVIFQHGSLREVIDHASESCGCPPPPKPDEPNPFPEAVAAGLAPVPQPPANAATPGEPHAQLSATLSHNAAAEPAPAPAPTAAPEAKKPGAMARLGHWLSHIFGGK